MDENKSGVMSSYGGRKIRMEGQLDETDLQSSIAQPSTAGNTSGETGLTFGQACSDGMIKTGMIVVFKDCNFGPIELDEEMTGENQKITGELNKGVVVKNKDGKYAIFCLLKLKEALILRGRYGRANGYRSIKHLISKITTKIKKCNAQFLKIEDFRDFCNEDNLVLSYFMNEPRTVDSVLFDEHVYLWYVRKCDLLYERLMINPGSIKHSIGELAVIIDGDVMNCNLKENCAITISELHSYSNNPYNKYVEIRGQ